MCSKLQNTQTYKLFGHLDDFESSSGMTGMRGMTDILVISKIVPKRLIGYLGDFETRLETTGRTFR